MLMNKIYAVISTSGSYDERYECVERCFKDIKKAEAYKAELEADNEKALAMATKCRECAGICKDCPLWIASTDILDECENYMNYAYYCNIDYHIREYDYEE